MLKEIYRNNTFTTIDENKAPRTFKELRGFLICNQGKDCFCKWGGNVYKITREGKWECVCRTLPSLSFKEYLKISLQ